LTIHARLLASLGLLGLTACAQLDARHAPLAGFQPSAADPRVWTVAGGEAQARQVSALLDDAIGRVEGVHGLPFQTPPRVHVCPDDPCFSRHVRTPGLTAAVVADNRLILSPRLFGREAARLPGILVHELSHLHLGQRVGHYTAWFPVWFHEGLATLVADGAGSEYASPFQAGIIWNEGGQIDFGARDTPERRHRADAFQLNIHHFYRQSWRFMTWLRQRDPAAFRAWLLALQLGADFHIALADAYNCQIEVLARDFASTPP
jgi:hypothetical protein